MGVLTSDLLKDNAQLQDCSIKNSAHISQKDNKIGAHVTKIQTALIRIDPTLKIAQDITALNSGASVNLAVPRWDALGTHFHLSFQVITATTRAVTQADLDF